MGRTFVKQTYFVCPKCQEKLAHVTLSARGVEFSCPCGRDHLSGPPLYVESFFDRSDRDVYDVYATPAAAHQALFGQSDGRGAAPGPE